MEKVQETKLFSAQAKQQDWVNALNGSSVSSNDAAFRKQEYEKIFSRYERMKEAYKMFSGVSEIPILSNQYFNATVASFVRSFAGYLSIERDMDQPTALLWFDDVLGVYDERMVLPNLGKENLEGITNDVAFEDQTIDDAAITVSTGQLLIPGSVSAVLVSADKASRAVIKDDAHGNLLAPAGVLTTGTVDYRAGSIDFELSGATFMGGTYSIHAASDTPGNPVYGQIANNQKNRFKIGMKQILVHSMADTLFGDSNLVSMAQAQKSLNQNPMETLGNKLVEAYTKVINKMIVGETMRAFKGNSYQIDTTEWKTRFHDFNSRLNAFSAEMVNIDTLLADKSVKGVEATAYVVGTNVGNWFRQMRSTGEFTEEKGSTYVNDLLGFYHDIPVLRHTDVAPNKGYAIVKTAGGELAPVIVGQYLPLTWTPNIGNYSNPTQVVTGCFYQMGVRAISSELVQEFQLIQ